MFNSIHPNLKVPECEWPDLENVYAWIKPNIKTGPMKEYVEYILQNAPAPTMKGEFQVKEILVKLLNEEDKGQDEQKKIRMTYEKYDRLCEYNENLSDEMKAHRWPTEKEVRDLFRIGNSIEAAVKKAVWYLYTCAPATSSEKKIEKLINGFIRENVEFLEDDHNLCCKKDCNGS